MPTDETKAFFKENRDEISKMIMVENRRREVRNFEPLTVPEIDDAIIEMISLTKSGNRIRAFKFPMTGTPIEPNTQLEAPQGGEEARPAPTRAGMPPPPKGVKIANSYHFEVIVCGNGFLLNLTSDKNTEPFVFRTEREWAAICKDSIFKRLAELKRKKRAEANNEQGNGDRAGSTGGSDDSSEGPFGEDDTMGGNTRPNGRRRYRRLSPGFINPKNPRNKRVKIPLPSPSEVHQEALGNPVPENEEVIRSTAIEPAVDPENEVAND